MTCWTCEQQLRQSAPTATHRWIYIYRSLQHARLRRRQYRTVYAVLNRKHNLWSTYCSEADDRHVTKHRAASLRQQSYLCLQWALWGTELQLPLIYSLRHKKTCRFLSRPCIYIGLILPLPRSPLLPSFASFLLCDAVARCPSVRPFVTRWYSVETAKHIIKLFHRQVATPF